MIVTDIYPPEKLKELAERMKELDEKWDRILEAADEEFKDSQREMLRSYVRNYEPES